MPGDRVAPYGGPGSKDGRTIGLPRAAPLVQPNQPNITSLQKHGKRSRVSTDADSSRQEASSSTQDTAGAANGVELKSQFDQKGDHGMRSAVQEQRLQAYSKLASERCAKEVELAQQRAEKRRAARRPPHVWWGFHYFWPAEALEGNLSGDPMEDTQVGLLSVMRWHISRAAAATDRS